MESEGGSILSRGEGGDVEESSDLVAPSRARPAEGESVKLGRPTKCTPEVTREIVRFVTRGLPLKTAARAAGISYGAVKDWNARGKAENAEEPYASFYEAIETAKAEFASVHAGVVDDAGRMGDWKASAWLLERRTRDFVKREKIETDAKVEHSGGVRVELYVPDNGRGR